MSWLSDAIERLADRAKSVRNWAFDQVQKFIPDTRLGDEATAARDVVRDTLSQEIPGYGIVRNVMDRLTGEKERYDNRLAESMAVSDWERSESSAREAFEREKELWHMNADYNTEMSNTAYQRAVADMEAAGINPILAYQQGGASTPVMQSGSAPQGSSSRAQPTQKDSLNAILQFATNTARSVVNLAGKKK